MLIITDETGDRLSNKYFDVKYDKFYDNKQLQIKNQNTLKIKQISI